MSNAHELSLDELAQYFHLPIAEAAKEIGVCATVLKKICRKNNVPRWPHRKIKSINKMIQVLEGSLGKNDTDDTRIREEIKILVQHREFVMKNPDTLVKNYNKRKRPAKESDDEDSGELSGPPTPPAPKRAKAEERASGSSRPSAGASAGSESRVEASHDHEHHHVVPTAPYPVLTPAGIPAGAISVEEWMRLANPAAHPGVVGLAGYPMPLPMPYMPYGYPPLDGHDAMHIVPPPDFPHLVSVELPHHELHTMPQPTGMPHFMDGQMAMISMMPHGPHVEKGQFPGAGLPLGPQSFSVLPTHPTHPAPSVPVPAAPAPAPASVPAPAATAPTATAAPAASAPAPATHVTGQQPPQHQLPEWFHEEKDNSLNLQEKMGLV